MKVVLKGDPRKPKIVGCKKLVLFLLFYFVFLLAFLLKKLGLEQ